MAYRGENSPPIGLHYGSSGLLQRLILLNGGWSSYSDDGGATWSAAQALPIATGQWRTGAYSESLGRLVSVSGVGAANRVLYTDDGGDTWTPTAGILTKTWSAVCWSPSVVGGRFVAVANGGTAGQRVMTSEDGIFWQSRNTPSDSTWDSVIWVEDFGLFIAARTSGAGIMTSPTGVNWTSRATPAFASGQKWLGYNPSAARASCVCLAANSVSAYSIDGINWLAGDIVLQPAASDPGAAVSPRSQVIWRDDAGDKYRSTNCENFTTFPGQNIGDNRGAYANGRYVFLAEAPGGAVVASDDDGISFAQVGLSPANALGNWVSLSVFG